MARWTLLLLACFCLVFAPPASAQKKPPAKKAAAKDELTLEKLFPEKSMFGTTARSTSFSHDGRFAAYMFRPYTERRHGSDLWVYDVQKKQSTRVTSVSVMAEFRKSVRKVQEDRVKRAKAAVAASKKNSPAAKGKDKKKDSKDDGLTDEQRKGDWVGDKDADEEKAPRYAGISSYIWSKKAAELLFVAGGDVYRYQLGPKSITRLTRTSASERSVRYLPDGKGFTCVSDKALLRIMFDARQLEQLDPRLPAGEEMSSYRLSPDGNRLVLMTRKGQDRGESGKKVSIVNYRDRFAKVKEVPRQTADDPISDQTVSIYLYDLSDLMHERGELVRIFQQKLTGPRDRIGTPNWSLDSNQVVFADYNQKENRISVRLAPFKDPKADEKKKEKEVPDAKKSGTDGDGDEKKEETAGRSQGSSASSDVKVIDRPAKIVHQELHTGGPNTPSMVRPEFFADNRRLVLLSEITGFRQLHILDPVYETLNSLTKGNFEIYPSRISEDHRRLFVTTTKDHPAREHVYVVDLESGELKRLSPQDGRYSSVAVSDDGKRVLANFVRYGALSELFAIDVAGKKMDQLTHGQPEKARFVTKVRPEFFSYENRHGQKIQGMLFKPDGWSKKDKRPLLIYVYGGPLGTRKMVVDGSYSSDAFMFAWYMAKKHGYVTCTIDPRGVSGYGGLFEKSNYEQVGQPQVEDLVDGVKYLVEDFGVDPKRVGIHGWSFGGFQTQMCLYTAPEVFSVGIAGAGPTEWENYNSWYTTGTIGPSRVGQTDQKKFSLLPLAKNLKGKLLLLHGMEDSNVLYQDTVRVYRELLKSGKETLVELFLDPTGSHGLGGDVKQLARHRKYEEFLLRTLSPSQ